VCYGQDGSTVQKTADAGRREKLCARRLLSRPGLLSGATSPDQNSVTAVIAACAGERCAPCPASQLTWCASQETRVCAWIASRSPAHEAHQLPSVRA
jgi:hypothetical protein